MLVRTYAVIAAICLVSGAAMAQDAGQPQEAAPVKEKKVCRALTPTGSVMSKRVCLTRAEWAKFNAAYDKQNENFRDRQSRGGGNPPQ